MGGVKKQVDWAEIVKQAVESERMACAQVVKKMVAAEREACAKVAEACEDPWTPRYVDMSIGFKDAREKIAEQIRERGGE